LKELINKFINTNEILIAKTVTTGAKITLMMFLMLKFSHQAFPASQSSFSNTCFNIRNGLATITIHKNPTLTISTKANAISGKNNPIATAVLSISSHMLLPMLEFMLVSAKVAKSKREI
jgi:hypothetical protein